MSIFESVILGLIQGLTEFIPISSSGHLVLAQYFLSGASDHLFLEWINIGTMLALIVFFWKRITIIISDIVVRKNFQLARNILLTALPAGLVGYFAASAIEQNPFFGSIIVVAVMALVVGIIMIILERLPKASPVKNGEALTIPRALTIGIAQMIALIPGTSRSGSTIIAGRLLGLGPQEAAEYSFLASLPIMAGVTVKVALKDHAYLMAHLDTLIIANLVAFISGLIAVRFLMRYLAHHSLAVFGWYRVGLAAVIVILLLVQ
ncbi:MAG: Undecaprenyl-diphosphatase [Candidatus Saccharibacteria bacterium]|nr:Undecaprenyl-diphosphatase [Candidatus Saccharibacteria bacterium]